MQSYFESTDPHNTKHSSMINGSMHFIINRENNSNITNRVLQFVESIRSKIRTKKQHLFPLYQTETSLTTVGVGVVTRLPRGWAAGQQALPGPDSSAFFEGTIYSQSPLGPNRGPNRGPRNLWQREERNAQRRGRHPGAACHVGHLWRRRRCRRSSGRLSGARATRHFL